MNESYLEVTFRRGRPLAAYYYLPRQSRDKAFRTERVEPGMLIDFARDGRPIGIEITAPGKMTVADLNRVLKQLGAASVTPEELAPLLAA